MYAISSIRPRRIFNSHVERTTEFEVVLDNGFVGIGASPAGETISIYEDRLTRGDTSRIVREIERDGYLRRPLDQVDFDAYLTEKMEQFGRNNCYALSLGFHFATTGHFLTGKRPAWLQRVKAPRLCCNILNGGRHAYSNPVRSDFPEYLLVSKGSDIRAVVEHHNEIQREVRSSLADKPRMSVQGNYVYTFATTDNRECVEFLLQVRDKLGLAREFDLMIDASGGDLWRNGRYVLEVTDGSSRSSDEFCDYWLGFIRDYPLQFLEDPFAEVDRDAWTQLTCCQSRSSVIGDNFYSSDADRITGGAADSCTHGAIIKPNQAGTVSGVLKAIEAAQACGQTAIVSHRSISTEAPFEADLACLDSVDYIKIGPLSTDYSSVIRLNEILRITGEQ